MLENFDFSLLENEDFKEDSVRSFIIDELLKALGFVIKNDKKPNPLEISLSKTLKTQIQIGSNKALEASLTPDYMLFVNGKAHCILDAKAPNVKITKDSKAEKQAKSYLLAYPSPFYALCNGRTFMLFKAGTAEVLLEIDIEKELNAKLNALKNFVALPLPTPKPSQVQSKKDDEWYLSRDLPKPILKPKKQSAKRHFGCNAYFTRQSWDIVAQNIKNFTNEGDVVLDSFGGSGVTAIEAMMNNRLGIHTDLNPLSIFMVKALSAKVNLSELYDLSEAILSEFQILRPKNEKEAKAMLKNAKYYANAIDSEFGQTATLKMQDEILWIPKDEELRWTVKGLHSLYQLFSKSQLAELALLRKLIFKHTAPSGSKEYRIKQKNMRYSLLLAFYNTLSLINLTYRHTNTGGGNHFGFYYRYKLAKTPYFLDIVETFQRKVKLIKNGKEELQRTPHFYNAYFEPLQRVIKDFEGSMINQRTNLDKIDSVIEKTNGEKIFQADATNLKEIENESVDFIYTDPPYGAKIPYLDLSTMWNAWLDLSVDLDTREKECIEKGSLNKTRQEYHNLMEESLKEMFRVLKYNRWLAFVFQHQDPQLWQILRTSAENIGFEYVQTVRQNNGQMTIKQRQFTATMVSGQLIMYFRKVKNKETLYKDTLGDNTKTLIETAKEIIIHNNGATFAEISDALTLKAMNEGFLPEYLEIKDMKFFVSQHFDYDEKTKKYIFPEATEIKMELDKKAKRLIISYFNKCRKENRPALFSDICFEVIPKLVNGVTPDDRYIKEILIDIAEVINKETGEWGLKPKDSLFDEL